MINKPKISWTDWTDWVDRYIEGCVSECVGWWWCDKTKNLNQDTIMKGENPMNNSRLG